DHAVDDDRGLGIGYGYRFNNPWGVELSYTQVDSELTRTDIDMKLKHWQINGLYHFNVESDLKPVLMVGIVHLEGDAGALVRHTLALTLGAGVKYDITPRWRFRTDARWHYADDGPNDIYAVTLGLSYVLGGGSSRPAAAATTVAPAPSAPTATDSDGDGVP